MNRRAGLAAVLTACTAPAVGRNLRITRHRRLFDVVAQARDGDELELDPGEYRAQTALITQRRLTLRSRGARAVLHADGHSVESKALFVVRGGEVSIQGLEFRGARVAARNGAGIRFEGGTLHLHDCAFFDNEMGLLAASNASSDLTIERCEFGLAPRHPGGLYHLLYLGRMGVVRVLGSHFSGAWRGHLIKSRAIATQLVGNQLIDGDGGEASYELDLPNGGQARVVGNLIVKGSRPQNDAVVAFGAEGEAHPASELYLAHNTIVNEALQPATVLRSWPERLPAGSRQRLHNNLVLGAARPGSYGSSDDGNWQRPLEQIDRGRGQPPQLLPDAPPLPRVNPPPSAPEGMPGFPLGLRPLKHPQRWLPGAFQEQ